MNKYGRWVEEIQIQTGLCLVGMRVMVWSLEGRFREGMYVCISSDSADIWLPAR